MKKRLLAKTCNISCLLFGAIQFTLGIVFLACFDSIFHVILGTALDLSPGSVAFNEWRTNDPPLIMDLYFFNWTNPEQLKNKSAKPIFEEIGPYRYKEVKEKTDIVYFPHNDSMSYKYVKRYYFMEEESPRQLDDVLTIINLIPLSTAYKLRYSNFFVKYGASMLMNRFANMYETKTAREWIFEGFEEVILSHLHPFVDVPDKFGWFYARNNVGPPDVYTFHTKFDQEFGRIKLVNHRNRTNFFEDSCGDLQGSAGEFHPPYSKRSHITIYNSEMCTYQNLYYEEDVEIKGIRAYKFSASNVFDNGDTIPQAKCYCKGDCMPHGVLNVSTCRGNTPIFLSLPHFYNADKSYVNAVEGLNPNKQQHDFYLSLEPSSSIVVDCAGRMQLNVLLQPIEGFSMYSDVPKVMFPIFYFDQIFQANDSLAENLRLIQSAPNMSRIGSIVMIIVGSILLGYAFIGILFANRNVKKMKMPSQVDIMEAAPLKVIEKS